VDRAWSAAFSSGTTGRRGLERCINRSGTTGQFRRVYFILDNLIAAGKAEPMIIVMENGYASKAGVTPPEGARGNEAFGEVVMKDLIPGIDKSYRTKPERAHRAIAGLSTSSVTKAGCVAPQRSRERRGQKANDRL
jgi:hypothetical protein